MRIALIAPFPPQQNGIADYASALASSLQSSGVTVELPLLGLSLDANHLHHLSQVLAEIDWEQYDLVHAEIGGGRLIEFHAMRWLQQHQPTLPKTVTLHDPERVVWQPPTYPAFLKKWPALAYKIWTVLTDRWTLRAEKALCEACQQVIVLTQTGKQRLVLKLRLNPALVTVIPHGCLEIPAQPLPTLPPLGPLKLIYFGFIYRGKGIEDLIDALAWIVHHHPEAQSRLHLTLAGGTKPDTAFGGQSTYLDEIQARLAQHGMSGLQIEWKLDIPHAEIAHTIQAAHLVILPYIETKKLALLGKMSGTSGVLAWANACGRGVISSDARAFAEEVSYGNGLIVPQRDIPALGKAILSVLNNPEQLIAFQHHAKAQATARAWHSTGDKFAHLFQSLIH